MVVQFTAGVPLAGLRHFLGAASRENVYLPTVAWPVMRGHMEAGRDFGDSVAADFAGALRPWDMRPLSRAGRRELLDRLGPDEAVTALRGMLQLVYMQVAAKAQKEVSDWIGSRGILVKNYSFAITRTSLGGMRVGLPGEAREYLGRHAPSIRRGLRDYFRDSAAALLTEAYGFPDRDVPGLIRGLRLDAGEGVLGWSHAGAGRFGHTLGEYLDNALLPDPGKVLDQEQAMDVGTHFPRLSTAAGIPAEVPLVLVELRNWGAFADSLDEVRQSHARLGVIAREAYAKAAAASGPAGRGERGVARDEEEFLRAARDVLAREGWYRGAPGEARLVRLWDSLRASPRFRAAMGRDLIAQADFVIGYIASGGDPPELPAGPQAGALPAGRSGHQHHRGYDRGRRRG